MIAVTDIDVQDLVSPINITIPLYSALNTSNPNTTLGCGYIDTDETFKASGFEINTISSTLVTCSAYHLTPIGVQEYTGEKQGSQSSNETSITELPPYTPNVVVKTQDSWAVWVCVILVLLLIPGIIWGIWRDKKDLKNIEDIKSDR